MIPSTKTNFELEHWSLKLKVTTKRFAHTHGLPKEAVMLIQIVILTTDNDVKPWQILHRLEM